MLLLDLGNTRLKLAHAGAGDLDDVSAIAHRDNAAFHALLLAELRRRREAGVLAEAWLSSVHHGPAMDEVLAALSTHDFVTRRIEQAQPRDDLRLAYADISQLGVDRWLAMLGARVRFDGDLLLVSAGTALTIDLLDASGQHHGGCIAPSPMRIIDGLRLAAPHLPRPEPGAILQRHSLFATSTVDGLMAGAQGAIVGLVREAMDEARDRLGRAPTLLLTGGGAPMLAKALESTLQPLTFRSAVLHGLAILASEDKRIDDRIGDAV